ncbi:hypothetical protein FRC08_001994, partial [Ceratobasidium sp. 394]
MAGLQDYKHAAAQPDPEKSTGTVANDHGFNLRALDNDYSAESSGDGDGDGSEKGVTRSGTFMSRLRTWGVESRGFSEGTLGTVVYGLTFRQAAGVIVGFNLLAILPPAYFSTFGPKLGLRQMVQA